MAKRRPSKPQQITAIWRAKINARLFYLEAYEEVMAVCELMVQQEKAATVAQAFDRLMAGEKVTLDFKVSADTSQWRGICGMIDEPGSPVLGS